MVRETSSGLILGSPTAGAAMVMQDYPLKNGERLRIASAPVTLGDVARISMILDPDGNWIELSRRASVVGSLS